MIRDEVNKFRQIEIRRKIDEILSPATSCIIKGVSPIKFYIILCFCIIIILISLILYEAHTSFFESKLFSLKTKRCNFSVENGPSSQIIFPKHGPYNQRLGYIKIPTFTEILINKGFRIEQQAQWPEQMLKLVDRGLNTVYEEKNQAGLCIFDYRGRSIFCERYPSPIYHSFDEIPSILVKTLLLIEDKNLLDTINLRRNPAIDWPRFISALISHGGAKIGLKVKTPGASTLATQLEKYRHSPHGLTVSAREKYLQMVSASLRTYRDGENTVNARKKIIVDYFNSTPLSAYPGYGEVNGVGEGLTVWYGVSFDSANAILHKMEDGNTTRMLDSKEELKYAGVYYRMFLSLLIAQRRPSFYLLSEGEELNRKTEAYLRLLFKKGILSEGLFNSSLSTNVALKTKHPLTNGYTPFMLKKPVNIIRAPILRLLELPHLYDLDRLDLKVASVIDGQAQKGVFHFLERLYNPLLIDSMHLRNIQMLKKGDPNDVIYSFTLYERLGDYNLLRVQADSYNQPLNFNEGTKLDLGSTAKLRTLISYLEIIEKLHHCYKDMTKSELLSVKIGYDDRLSYWARSYFLSTKDTSLITMLNAALERMYSANPNARFFTGGGIHTFSNFDRRDDRHIISVREGFRRSVNLVFIRLMKDIVNYYVYQTPGGRKLLLDSVKISVREEYLKRFTQYEGQIYINRFYRQLSGINHIFLIDSLASDIKLTATRLAVLYNSVTDSPTIDGLRAVLLKYGLNDTTEFFLKRLLSNYKTTNYNLSDRGYIANVHPLKLWVASYLAKNPGATRQKVKEASIPYLLEVYQWLFKTRRISIQDKRIKMILEMDAFYEIYLSWKKLGYPFSELVPSYATALGASADRPSALAELAGIIQNDGIRNQTVRVTSLTFAEGTPYETILQRVVTPGTNVLSSSIAKIAKQCLFDVVEAGTAARVKNSFVNKKGKHLPVGGKTGTGDHRYKIYDHKGRLVREKIINRTATFMFIIGDRFFGTITVMVPGEKAKEYTFTSSYPAQLLKLLGPQLKTVISDPVISSEQIRSILISDKNNNLTEKDYLLF